MGGVGGIALELRRYISFALGVIVLLSGLLIIILLIAIPAALGIHYGNKTQKPFYLSEFLKSQGIETNQGFLSVDSETGIAINENLQEIYLYNRFNGTNNIRKIYYRDLLSSEIVCDGISVTKTERGSQLGGALVGGAFFGGVGALIGGLSGSQKTMQRVYSINLNILVNDTVKPIHTLTFLNQQTFEGSVTYNQAIEAADHWYALTRVLMNRAQ